MVTYAEQTEWIVFYSAANAETHQQNQPSYNHLLMKRRVSEAVYHMDMHEQNNYSVIITTDRTPPSERQHALTLSP